MIENFVHRAGTDGKRFSWRVNSHLFPGKQRYGSVRSGVARWSTACFERPAVLQWTG